MITNSHIRLLSWIPAVALIVIGIGAAFGLVWLILPGGIALAVMGIGTLPVLMLYRSQTPARRADQNLRGIITSLGIFLTIIIGLSLYMLFLSSQPQTDGIDAGIGQALADIGLSFVTAVCSAVHLALVLSRKNS